MHMTATYSPEDNKLRLYSTERLDAETYARVRAAGFIWAPKQQLFVAPMWTPEREDLLIELCGEVGDEDTSLVERAEQRAERFEDYRERRTDDAHRAHQAVAAIADNIPLGQPILVGHHSERHARRDAERIENGMRRAVRLWDTAQYWKYRAASAIRNAKYKELPGVRHRRIKGLEADKRSHERNIQQAQQRAAMWQTWKDSEDRNPEIALKIANASCSYEAYTALRTGTKTALEVCEGAIGSCARIVATAERWIQHIENRLAYERAMLDEQGGDRAGRWDVQVGGRVLVGGEWLVVLRVNKSAGSVNSVTTSAPAHVTWTKQWKYGIEKVRDYRAPEGEEAAKVKAATKLPPLCNFRSEGCIEMTSEEWKRSTRASDFWHVKKFAATETTGAYRHPYRATLTGKDTMVFLTDKPVKTPPKAESTAKPEDVGFERRILPSAERPEPSPEAAQVKQEAKQESEGFETLRETLRAGVQVVSAPQLFPTPPELARRMVEAAGVEPGHRVLEPSVGTGNIAKAIFGAAPVHIVAVEINPRVLESFTQSYRSWNNSRIETRCADFLQCNGDLGTFDRILMNPPFANGQDITHIRHALHMLKPGGRLVAICANGPRQNEQLRPLVEEHGGKWEPLPPGTFAVSGTQVSAVLLTINA